MIPSLRSAAGLAFAAVLTLGGGPAAGQLISPGKLSASHSELEGIRNCTQCHELRKAGISEALCLGCHQPLKERVEEGRGFHASVDGEGCATCHKEHFGAGFALVRLDTLTFDHGRTGYALEGAHVGTSCRACHTAGNVTDPLVRSFKGEHGSLPRTFLGLPDACAACHARTQPHEKQFAERACSDCHDAVDWKDPVAFDHAGTAFPLTGEHASVACDGCHSTESRPGVPSTVVRYAGVAFGSCADCHEDEHGGAMPGTCAGCHTTAGWKNVDRARLRSTFDHRATGFPLEGRHAAASCASCHDAGAAARLDGIHLTFEGGQAGAAFPRPRGDACLSCHEDEHGGAMPEECLDCHTMVGWKKVDAERVAARFDHASTGFLLEGSHAVTACASCHDAEVASGIAGISIRFDPDAGGSAFPAPVGPTAACGSCHLDQHAGAFEESPGGSDCRRCHSQVAWVPATYDATRHAREGGFALDGAHAAVACVDCHEATGGVPTFAVADPTCRGCHGGLDPHGAQFEGRGCDACHATGSFRIPQFDHASTRFPLDGAHEVAECRACHVTRSDADGVDRVVYRPLGLACRDCHGGVGT